MQSFPQPLSAAQETVYLRQYQNGDMHARDILIERNLRLVAHIVKKYMNSGKETDEMIGQCGLTMQPWKDKEVLEIGYLFQRRYWHKGYATEAAKACKKYAFKILNADEVCSIIRDTNTPSQNVAVRNGMTVADSWTKHYRGVDMPHYRYVAVR